MIRAAHCARSRGLHARPVAARGIALLALLLAPVTLGGCSVMSLGRHIGLPMHHPKVRASAPTDRTTETREQIALQPQQPYWPYRLGQIELAADSLDAAEAALRASLERDPNYAPALSLLSKLYFETGRHAEAVKLLEPARSRPGAFSSDARQMLLAGLALHEDALGRPDLAGAALTGMARADLEHAGSAMVYVTLRGETPDSAGALATAALGADRSAANLNNFGITRLRAGDPESARRAFQSAIDRDPSLPGPYYNLAILEKYYRLDDAAAARWFKTYWKRSQDDPDSLLGVFSAGEPGGVAQKGN
jgi:tetratricopeptide (TPR) repeat protein